jgi:hypothetical protein
VILCVRLKDIAGILEVLADEGSGVKVAGG